MTDITLAHCPFCYPHPACDEYPPFVTQEIGGSNSWSVWARCCDFYGPLFSTPELAAEAWNRRGMVTKLEDKETIDLFEGILGADPEAFLTDSIVYSVTQNELLKFASVLAPRHAMEAVARLQRRLTAEREGMEEYKARQNLAVTELEQELEDAVTLGDQLHVDRNGLIELITMMMGHTPTVHFSTLLKNGQGGAGASRSVIKFMCTVIDLLLLDEQTPSIAKGAFSVARQYWFEGVGTESDLDVARSQCWEFLEAKGSGVDISDNEDAVTRALLCVLSPDKIDDEDFVHESLEWLFEMVSSFTEVRLHQRLTAEREVGEEHKSQHNLAITALEQELADKTQSAARWEKRYEQQKGCARTFKSQRDQIRADTDLALLFANSLLESLSHLDENSMSGVDCELIALLQSQVNEFISTMQAHEKYYTSQNEVIIAPSKELEDTKRLCILLSSDRKDMIDLLRKFSEDIDVTDVQLVAEMIQSTLGGMHKRRDEIFQISERLF